MVIEIYVILATALVTLMLYVFLLSTPMKSYETTQTRAVIVILAVCIPFIFNDGMWPWEAGNDFQLTAAECADCPVMVYNLGTRIAQSFGAWHTELEPCI